jgi:hypothetical protein
MSATQPFNSISGLADKPEEELLRHLFMENLPPRQIFDAMFAKFSNMSVEDLLKLVEGSSLFSMLGIVQQLLKSGVMHDMGVESVLSDMFEGFRNQQKGKQHLFAVIALVQLLRLPTNMVSNEQNKMIEEVKFLFLSTLFHNDIVIHFMVTHEQQQQDASLCPCPNCNKTYILSIGWYMLAQDAHNADAFVKNEG